MKKLSKILSVLLALVMVVGMLPMTALTAFARTITPVETGGGMNLRTDATGKLLWDPIAGATGYRIDVCVHPGNSVLMTESVGADTTSYALYAELDDRTFDNGDYRVELHVSGANAEYSSSTLIIYYDSPYEKLQSPTNLRWNGDVAEWDAVTNATRYNVYVCNTTTGDLSVRSNITETSVDLSYLSPQDGWYFEVAAFDSGYRNSEVSESPRKGGGSRNIVPVDEPGAMNLKLLANGTLLWDKFDDATSYRVDICQHPGNHVYKSININKNNQYCALIEVMDAERLNNGDYRIEVFANGSGSDHPYQSMLMYYDSPYSRLAAPGNPHWNGLFASWDAVPGAEYYNVYVSDPVEGSMSVKSNVKETFVSLADLEPQEGWFFEVFAFGSGYRNSTSSESPRRGFFIGVDSYNASLDEPYSGGKVKLETGAEVSDYSYIGYSFEVPNGAEVGVTALPDEGYEFVEWRIGSETGDCFSKAKSVGFYASESVVLVAVFHKSIPAGMGTTNNPVVCNNYEELKYALEHPTVQGILVNNFANDPYQTFYTLQKEKDFKKGHCAITIPTNSTKYLTINADINIRVPYIDYLLYSFIDNRGSLTVGGTGSLNVSMNARGYPSAIIYNNGELNIGGSVTFDPTNKSFDSVHGYSVINASGSTVINSGTFIGYATSAVLYQQGSLDIYDGTFKIINGDDQAFGLNTDTYLTTEEHNVNLYGGTFDGIRADQTIGEDIVKLPDLLGYGAYYTYYSDGSKFDPNDIKDTHETLTVKMNNIVRDIELTIDQPKQNGMPDQTVICGDYAYKQATGNDDMWDDVDVYWEESTDGQVWTKMASTDTFTVGYHYRAAVNVMTRNGNIFDIDEQIEPNVVATINGYYAEVFRYPEEDPSNLICMRFDFGILNDNIIEQIDIDGVTEPVVGEHPNYNCAISGTGYTINTAYSNGTYVINGICWKDTTDDKWLYPKDTFEIGHKYKVYIDVKTTDGYEFYTTGGSYKPAGWGYINGNYATLGVQSWANTEQSLSWEFTCQPKTFKSIGITGLDIPTDGFTPDFDAVTDSEYYTVESIEWMDCENDANEMTAFDTFVAGNKYWALITIVPKEIDGNKLCEFLASNKTIATLNGIKVEKVKNDSWQDVTSSVKAVRIYYTFTALGEENYSISGTITSGGDNTAPITVQLIPEGLPEVVYETIVTGNDASYYFAGITPGTYDVKLTKADHDEFVGTVTVTNDNVMYNVTLKYNDPNPIPSSNYGDTNGDGSIDNKDYALLMQHLNGWSVTIDLSVADTNVDGSVDNKDYALLMQYLNDWDVTLGPKS